MKLSHEDFDLLRNYINTECGLCIGDDKKYLVECRLKKLLQETNTPDYHSFYLKVKSGHDKGLRDRIVDTITTHETLWFRDLSPWTAMRKLVLPQLSASLRNKEKSKIRIWSAACSTGQEPYSVCLLLDSMMRSGELKGVNLDQFEIIATDVSPASIQRAQLGEYDKFEVKRGLNASMLKNYFDATEDKYQIKEDIRKRILFKVYNLQDDFLALGRMDLVLCRNVLIYFSQEFKQQLLRRFAMIMNPGAFFFLGSTESGLGHEHTFDLHEYESAIYYQLKKF